MCIVSPISLRLCSIAFLDMSFLHRCSYSYSLHSWNEKIFNLLLGLPPKLLPTLHWIQTHWNCRILHDYIPPVTFSDNCQSYKYFVPLYFTYLSPFFTPYWLVQVFVTSVCRKDFYLNKTTLRVVYTMHLFEKFSALHAPHLTDKVYWIDLKI